MSLFSRRSNRPAASHPKPRACLSLERLEDRTVLSTFMVVAPNLANNQTSFGSLQQALNAAQAAGPNNTVQVEPGALPGSATTVVTSSTAIPVNIIGDPTFGPNNLAAQNITVADNGVVIVGMNLGNVTIDNSNAPFDTHSISTTVERSVITGQVTELGGTKTNGGNLISANTFLTNPGSTTTAGLVLQNTGTGGVQNDQVIENTFISAVATGAFNQPFITATAETAGLVITGNTFRDRDPTLSSVGVLLADDTGVVDNNTFDFAPNGGSINLSITNRDSTVTGVSNTVDLSVDNNTFNTAFTGTGVLTNKQFPVRTTGTSIYQVELSNNSFQNNLVGVEIVGLGNGWPPAPSPHPATETDFGTIVLGGTATNDTNGMSVTSVGGNDFRIFNGAPSNWAILVLDHGASPATTIEARNNMFGPITPSGVINVPAAVTKVDSSMPMSVGGGPVPFAATLQVHFRNFLGRSPSSSELASFTNVNNTMGPLAVANTVVRSGEASSILVDQLYLELLGRHADPSGLNSWVSVLTNGGTEEQVIVALLTSAEYYNHVAQQYPGGDPTVAWINSLYQNLLGRTPAPTEVQGWLAMANTQGLAAVATNIVHSQEFRSDQVGAMYGAPQVGVIAAPNLLHRRAIPSPAELSQWVNSGLDLRSIAVVLITSGEYNAVG
jgi:hypothetical protein